MICNWKQQFDIQRFAEGGAAGGAAAAAGSAADAGQPGEGAGAGAQSAPNAAQTGQDATAGETPRDLKAEFDALVKGEYKGEFDARVQKIINQRFAKAKAAEEANGKMQAAMDVLAQRYSLKADDYDGIAAALNDDQKLYEEAAGEAGMDVKQFMRVQQLERENARYQRQQAELAQRRQMDQAYQRLMQEADGVKAQYPAFDLNAEMQDPDFVRLLRAQVPLKTIYEVRHQDEILGGAMQYTAQKVAAKVAAGVSANRGRPAENGAAASGASGARFGSRSLRRARGSLTSSWRLTSSSTRTAWRPARRARAAAGVLRAGAVREAAGAARAAATIPCSIGSARLTRWRAADRAMIPAPAQARLALPT